MHTKTVITNSLDIGRMAVPEGEKLRFNVLLSRDEPLPPLLDPLIRQDQDTLRTLEQSSAIGFHLLNPYQHSICRSRIGGDNAGSR